MQVLNILSPVFLLIGIGVVLQASKFVSPGFLKEANRLTYWLGLPALLFSQLAASFHDVGGARLMFGGMFLATGLVVLLGYAASHGYCAYRAHRSAHLCKVAFRGNLAFIGLPVIYSLPGRNAGVGRFRAHGGDSDRGANDGGL